MKISRLIFAGIIATILIAGCSKEEDMFSISGKITHAEGQTIYLEELKVASSIMIDSVKIDKNGTFRFTGKTGIPSYYLLKLSENKFITLLVDSVEQVVVEADLANFERNYRVEGSLGSVQVKTLNDHLATTRKRLDSIQSLHNLYRGNPDYRQLRQEWDQAYDSIKQAQTEFSTQFVMSNPFSMASVLALYQKFDDQEYIIKDLHTMRVAASALNTIYPNSGHVKALYQNTVQLLQEEQNAKLRQMIQEQGENSPEIVLPDPDGNEIALSSLRGKIVLLQFWSALDRNSRILNEALAEAYRKYKNKGFEIYQVSVDDNRIEWVSAIDEDGLSWINVGDMEGSNLAARNYNIQTIPYNYLLNEDGEIIAQNLRGPGLDRALSRLLN
ncbi:MAG TPA: AhpC/TSA family protein [Mariniphaga anaerophila]|uniref:AhpC/TSA family protein n=1 Tax=Mariniphaga anaerophila TaxID=1484053 RepID=A0A831LN88_9BACT|nr:AhpC/TSA family protein [Mariniphaga anaerophila]